MTATTKHTPGPLQVETHEEAPYTYTPHAYLVDAKGRRVASVQWTKGYHSAAEDAFFREEALAHANLFAAAPDLLEALIDCAGELSRLRSVLLPQYEGKIGEPDNNIIGQAHAAVAKARGEGGR